MNRIRSVVPPRHDLDRQDSDSRFPNLEKYVPSFGILPFLGTYNINAMKMLIMLEDELQLPRGIIVTTFRLSQYLRARLDMFNLYETTMIRSLTDIVEERLRIGKGKVAQILTELYANYIIIRSVVEKLGRYPVLIEELYRGLSYNSKIVDECLSFHDKISKMRIKINRFIVETYIRDDIYTILSFYDKVIGELGNKLEVLIQLRPWYDSQFYSALNVTGHYYESWLYLASKIRHMMDIVMKFRKYFRDDENSIIQIGVLRHIIADGAELYVLEQISSMLVELAEECRKTLKKLSIELPALPDQQSLEQVPETELVAPVRIPSPYFTGIGFIDEWKRKVVNYYMMLYRRIVSLCYWFEKAYRKVMSILEKQYDTARLVKISLSAPVFHYVDSLLNRETYHNVDLTLYVYRDRIYCEYRRENSGENFFDIEPAHNLATVTTIATFLLNLPTIVEYGKIEDVLPSSYEELKRLIHCLKGKV